MFLLLFAAALAAYAFVIRARADSILQDVRVLRVGVSGSADVERLVERHRSSIQEQSCDKQKCFIAFEVYNTWLYRLRLEPFARFRVKVNEQNGIVDYIGIILSRDTRRFPTSPSAGMTNEYLRIPEHMIDFSHPPYWFPSPVGKPYIDVALTSEATALQRDHAYGFSLTCLIKPGDGCDLPCDYLPLAWHDWQAELETQHFGAEGFGPYYPDRARCK